jgi:7,8-dihydroneopterin aldolase/epimerase/oxygenase
MLLLEDKGAWAIMDKILLTGLQFRGFHGVLAEEKALGQRFIIDLELMGDFRLAAENDDILRAVNYAEVYTEVKQIVEGTDYNLIEGLAECISSRLLDKFPLLGVVIRVNKPQAPIPGVFGNVAVEIKRGLAYEG